MDSDRYKDLLNRDRKKKITESMSDKLIELNNMKNVVNVYL